MKKINGQRGRLMGMEYVRVMPQAQLQTVGSFFLLDHFFERELPPQDITSQSSTGPHPHRGIITLTYVIKGRNEHLDSLGHHVVVDSGSVQWMKSGRGIVHDEGSPADFKKEGGVLHMMQFWLLLREDEREDAPQYIPLKSEDIPEKVLDEKGAKLRVLLGEYCNAKSPLPSRQSSFLFHLVLEPGSEYYFTIPQGVNVAIFPVKGGVEVNENFVAQSDLLAFENEEETLKLINRNTDTVDVMLFGGEAFDEPFYSNGPFVMKDYEGMVQAYQDYNAGKYGEIE